MAKADAKDIMKDILYTKTSNMSLIYYNSSVTWNRQVATGNEILKVDYGLGSVVYTIPYTSTKTHYSYTFTKASTALYNRLGFYWFTSSSESSAQDYIIFPFTDHVYSYYTISFDILNYQISNLVIVPGQTEYTWKLIYEPIVIINDVEPGYSGANEREAIIAASEYWSRWYEIGTSMVRWEIFEGATQEYVDGLAIRYADLTGTIESESI